METCLALKSCCVCVTIHIYFSVELIRLIQAHWVIVLAHILVIFLQSCSWDKHHNQGCELHSNSLRCGGAVSAVFCQHWARRALRTVIHDCSSTKLVRDNSGLALILASMIEGRLSSDDALPKSFKLCWLWSTGCHDLCLMIEIYHFRLMWHLQIEGRRLHYKLFHFEEYNLSKCNETAIIEPTFPLLNWSSLRAMICAKYWVAWPITLSWPQHPSTVFADE